MTPAASEAYIIPFGSQLCNRLKTELEKPFADETSAGTIGKHVLDQLGWHSALTAELVRAEATMKENGCDPAEIEAFQIGVCEGFEIGLGIVALVLKIRTGSSDDLALHIDDQDWYAYIVRDGTLFESYDLNGNISSHISTDN